MEKKSAIVTYGIKKSESIIRAFCKKEKDFYKRLMKTMDEVGEREESLSKIVDTALQEGLLDGADLLILATIGLKSELRNLQMIKIQEKIKKGGIPLGGILRIVLGGGSPEECKDCDHKEECEHECEEKSEEECENPDGD